MALFPVPRYMGEDEKEGTVRSVMTLKELHTIAKERAKSITGREAGTIIKKEVREMDVDDNKKTKGKKRMKKLEPDTESSEQLKPKKRKHDVKASEETMEHDEACNDDGGDDETEENDEEDNPLPMVTHSERYRPSTQLTYHHLPDWVTQSHHIESDIAEYSQSLEDFALNPIITDNLHKMSVTSLFPVQCVVLPELLSSSHGPLLSTVSGAPPSDMCICAPTGCGKTLSYVVPIVSSLLNRITRELKALVVVPSKDLALQVYNVFVSVSKGTRVRIGAVGSQNTSFSVEQKQLISHHGPAVDVLVATPGRLVRHLQETPFLSLASLRYLVIDEADRIFEQSYHNWLNTVMDSIRETHSSGHCPLSSSCIPRMYPELWKPSFSKSLLKHKGMHTDSQLSSSINDLIYPAAAPLQKLLFSATLSLDPEQLHLLQLYRPKLFTATPALQEDLGQSILPSTLKEYSISCSSDYKPLVLLHLILTFDHHRILCFTHSRESTHRLTLLLKEYDAPVAEISGDLSQEKKNELIKKLTGKEIKALVCSDGMARGMDIPGIDCVINYDVPSHFRSYLHRVGRTARAGAEGAAYTLNTFEEVHKWQRMIREAGRKQIENVSITEDDLKQYVIKYSDALESVANSITCKRK
ncbi:PREDICTED: ATP-dependent RNA helicase DDX51-like [Amphimedon queenslandica]|uniref:ATP-dependent RNA helicase n=1 Tax=Amphimedon queenslandica TaxID=400682 RepID=A0A1X7VW49_AMPQE|nr:PREDICTED: ATP-dependent RNA helicase DDX51-like [Amphimedon queenslandica]|eukprot:XP_003382683.1 PREDICTED: ATP-dependent RNA helicase DDX51-like [Amphimedon queenslandica]